MVLFHFFNILNFYHYKNPKSNIVNWAFNRIGNEALRDQISNLPSLSKTSFRLNTDPSMYFSFAFFSSLCPLQTHGLSSASQWPAMPPRYQPLIAVSRCSCPGWKTSWRRSGSRATEQTEAVQGPTQPDGAMTSAMTTTCIQPPAPFHGTMC